MTARRRLTTAAPHVHRKRAWTTRTVRGVRGHLSEPLYRTAYSLMAATVLTSLLGIAFWVGAARLYPPEVVGRDGALITSMVGLSAVAQLNMLAVVDRFLPRMRDRTARALLLAYATTAAAALLISVGFVVVVPVFVPDLHVLHAEPGIAAMYVITMVAWGVFVIQDAALGAVQAAPWIALENTIYSALKIAALPIMLVLLPSHGVFAAWLLPVLLLLPPVNWLLFRRAIPRHVAAQGDGPTALDDFSRRSLMRLLAQDYAGSLVSHAAFTFLPLLVVGMLGSSANAYFNTALTVVVAFDMLFLNAVTSFTIACVASGTDIGTLTQAVVRRLLVPLAGAGVVLILIAPLILLPFGGDYAREATPLVRILACASVFRGTLVLYLATCRLHGRARPLLLVPVVHFVLLTGFALALTPSMGLEGVALAWLVSHAAVAIVTGRPFVEALRPGRRRGEVAVP